MQKGTTSRANPWVTSGLISWTYNKPKSFEADEAYSAQQDVVHTWAIIPETTKTLVLLGQELTVKAEYRNAAKVFEQVKVISALPDNWDNEGAERITHGVLMEVALLYLQYAEFNSDVAAKPPDVSPLTNGSVDLYWLKEGKRLLLNVAPVNGDFQIEFFFKNPNTLTYFSGQLDPSGVNPEVAAWMRQM
jgi:hypothetical protein